MHTLEQPSPLQHHQQRSFLQHLIAVGLPKHPTIKQNTQSIKWITSLAIINQLQHQQLLNTQPSYIYDPHVKIIELGNDLYLKVQFCEKHQKPIIRIKACSKLGTEVQNLVEYPNETKYDEYLWVERGDKSKYSKIIEDVEMIEEKGSEPFDLPQHQHSNFEMLRLPAAFQNIPEENSSNEHLIESTKFLLIKILQIEDQDNISQQLEPAILFNHRFPHSSIHIDLKTFPNFCFPEGITLKNQVKGNGYYIFNFILTQEDNSRIYISCIIVREKLREQQIEGLPSNFIDHHLLHHQQFYSQKAYCLASKVSHTDFFNHLLQELFRQYASLQYQCKLKGNHSLITFESVVRNFIHQYQRSLTEFIKLQQEMQFMSEDLRLEVELTRTKITFPQMNSSFTHVYSHKAMYCLFKMLSIENIVEIVTGLLLEKKLILVCDAQIALGYVIQALISLLYPLEWEYAILPIVSENLMGYLDAPIPLIASIPTSLARDQFLVNIKDAKIVFLDCNILLGEPTLKAKDVIYFKELTKKLRHYQIYSKVQVSKMLAFKEEFYLFKVFEIEDKYFSAEMIKHIFFEVILLLLQGYDKFYLQDKQANSPNKQKGEGIRKFNAKRNYNMQQFIKSHHKSSRLFMQKFIQSSHFIHLLHKCSNPDNNLFRKNIDKALMLHKNHHQNYEQSYPFRYSERPFVENQEIANLKKKGSLEYSHNNTWSPPPKKSDSITTNYSANNKFNLKMEDIQMEKEGSISQQAEIRSAGRLKSQQGSSKQESKAGQICEAISKMLNKASRENVVLWSQARVSRLKKMLGVREREAQGKEEIVQHEIRLQNNQKIDEKNN